MRAQGSRDRSNLLRRCQSGDRGVGWASVRECHPNVSAWQCGGSVTVRVSSGVYVATGESETYSWNTMSRRRLAALAVPAAVLGLSLVVSGCGRSAPPFASDAGIESGPSSRLWGDGSSGPDGMEIGCIHGRRFAVLITARNQTKRTVMLLGAGGPPPLLGVIDRVAVQVRLAPPPPTGDIAVMGLRAWSGQNPKPVAIPPGRSAWVQSNFLMRNCDLLSRPSSVDGAITLRYRAGGSLGSQVVSVPAAQILLTRGPQHPSLPINQTG